MSTSSASGSQRIASVGQASAHISQPSGHFVRSTIGSPRKRSGICGEPLGYAMVRYPCRMRSRMMLCMMPPELQIVTAIGEIEALVAQREIGDGLVAQG